MSGKAGFVAVGIDEEGAAVDNAVGLLCFGTPEGAALIRSQGLVRMATNP